MRWLGDLGGALAKLLRFDAAQVLTAGEKAQAQANLGLGSMATQGAGAVAITGGDGAFSSLKVGLSAVWHAGNFTPGTAATAALDTDTTLAANSDTRIASQKAVKAAIAAAVAGLLNSAPGALDTLNELAAALGDDPNFAATVTAAIAGKQASLGYTPVQQGTGTGQSANHIKIGWGGDRLLFQVDVTNFADTWPISIDGSATALNGKADTAFATAAQGTKADTAVQPAALAAKASLGAAVSFQDVTADRGDGTGVIFLGNTGHYLYFDGVNYTLVGTAQLTINGSVAWHAGNFNPATKITTDGVSQAGLSAGNLEAPYFMRSSDAAISWLATTVALETRAAAWAATRASAEQGIKADNAVQAATLAAAIATCAAINPATSSGETNFPIGTLLLATGFTGRSATTTLRQISTGTPSAVLGYATSGSGAAIAGTWRSCGCTMVAAGTAGETAIFVAQRVA